MNSDRNRIKPFKIHIEIQWIPIEILWIHINVQPKIPWIPIEIPWNHIKSTLQSHEFQWKSRETTLKSTLKSHETTLRIPLIFEDCLPGLHQLGNAFSLPSWVCRGVVPGNQGFPSHGEPVGAEFSNHSYLIVIIGNNYQVGKE